MSWVDLQLSRSRSAVGDLVVRFGVPVSIEEAARRFGADPASFYAASPLTNAWHLDAPSGGGRTAMGARCR